MTDYTDAFLLYKDFLVQKCKKELTEQRKPNAPYITELISVDVLQHVYQYSDCPEWKRYIIDLDGEVAPEAFSHENLLYQHTPRIFKTGDILGIEKLCRTQLFAEEFREAIQQAVTTAAQQGIIIAYQTTNPSDSVYLIQESDQLKVKFAYFRLRAARTHMEGGGKDG